MVPSSQDYTNAMKEMICKVQNGYEPPFDASDEELELLSDCIKEGYIRGRTTYIGSDGRERELRTLDGKIHPQIINHIIPPKGLSFLSEQDKRNEPDKADTSSGNDKPRKKFYQSGVFWTVIGIVVTVSLWLIDRFYFGIMP